MKLNNAKIGARYQVDKKIISLIHFMSNVELKADEQEIFGYASSLIANHSEFNKLRKRSVTVIFSKSNTVSLSFPDGTIGSQGSTIFINYSRWSGLDETRKLICLLEEFVHHFWDEQNEIETSRIVCSFFNGLDYDKSTGQYKI